MHSNRSLGIVDIVFGLRGRIGRLAFIGYSALIGMIGLGAFFAAVQAFGVNAASPRQTIMIFFGLPSIMMFWVGVALLTKRLHDLNCSGYHTIWITALWYGAPWMPEPLQTILSCVCIPISIGLIFVRGSAGPNPHGPETGTTWISEHAGMPIAT